MSYKGYTAQIELVGRDNIYVGCVWGVDSIISFHGESMAELRERFGQVINDLLVDMVKLILIK